MKLEDRIKSVEEVLIAFPKEAQENYYKNKQTLEIEMTSSHNSSGTYYVDDNKIVLKTDKALEHELFHVASTDRDRIRTEISEGIILRDGVTFATSEGYLHGYGLTEGLVESLARKTRTKDDFARSFEAYIVDLLISIHGEKLYYYLLTNNPYRFYKSFNEENICLICNSLDLYEDIFEEKLPALLSLDSETTRNAVAIVTASMVKDLSNTQTQAITGVIREYNNYDNPKVTRIEFKKQIEEYFHNSTFLTDSKLIQAIGTNLRKEIEEIVDTELMQKKRIKQ